MDGFAISGRVVAMVGVGISGRVVAMVGVAIPGTSRTLMRRGSILLSRNLWKGIAGRG